MFVYIYTYNIYIYIPALYLINYKTLQIAFHRKR